MQSAFVFNTNPIIYFVYFLCSCSAAVGCLGRWWALLRQSPRQCFWATVFPFQQSIPPWLLLFPLLPFRIWFSLTHTHSLSNLFTITSILLLMFSRLLSSILYIKIVDEQRRSYGYVCWNILNFLKRSKKEQKRQRDYTCEYWRKQKRRNTFFYYYNYTILQKEEERGRSSISTNLKEKNLNFFN